MIQKTKIHEETPRRMRRMLQVAAGFFGLLIAVCASVGGYTPTVQAATPCIQIEGGSTNYTDPTKPLNPNSPIAYHNAPICGTVAPYYGRGNRMPNVGVSINSQGYAIQFNADGSFRRAVCMIPERGCGAVGSSNTGATGIAAADEIGTPIGWVDTADCTTISGWALDANDPNATISIHIYKDASAGRGGVLVGSAVANKPRPDLYGPFNTTADHGFSLPTPEAFKDGKSHPLFIHAIDTSGNGVENLLIGASKKTIPACTGQTGGAAVTEGTSSGGKTDDGATGATGATSNGGAVLPGQDANLVGSLDAVNCAQFTGWALDKSNPTAAVNINFYVDGPGDGPVDKRGKLMTDFAVTSVERSDVNAAYGVTGNHGFVFRFASVLGNPIADGKAHQIYAYAVSKETNTRYSLLMNSPKTVFACTSSTGGGGGGGGSSRHNFLSSCKGNGDFDDKVDPTVYAEVKGGVVVITIKPAPGQATPVIKDSKGNTVTPTVNADGSLTYTYTAGGATTITVGGHAYTVDTDGLSNNGDTVSILVPTPCIRIGYDDILGGQQCGEGESGTCAKELDAFINVDGIQNTGLHINVPPLKDKPNNGDDFSVQYKVVGDQTNTNGWKDYDWRACGQYSNHCIRLKGKGVISARTRLTGKENHYSLTTSKKFDADTGDAGLEDYDPL